MFKNFKVGKRKRENKLFLFLGMFLFIFGLIISFGYKAFAANPDDGFIISEYIEGSSNNKAIELYNGSNFDINLSGYKLLWYNNGFSTPGTPLMLSGILTKGSTFVIVNNQATVDLKNRADLITNSPVLTFNGDDAISLARSNDTHVDVFGQTGSDPGNAWTAGGVTTVNKTLVRKPTVGIGDAIGNNVFNPSIERIQYNEDTFTNLGSHFMDIIKPIATIDLASGQNTSGTSLTGKFLVSFSEPISRITFVCDDINFIGTAVGQTCVNINEIAPNNGTTFEVITTASNDGTIMINIANDKVTDIAGNGNGTTIITNNAITIDRSSLWLSPGDIVIVTANANPDFFEFLVRKDINPGTSIYFSDNAWQEDKTRRSGEGTLIFTSTTTITAGTIISIEGIEETPHLIQNTLGIIQKNDNFNLAVNGDNILVYQGNSYNTATPVFIHGFGFANANPRISDGSPTANNSYLPTSSAINYNTMHRNTQYTCSNTDILSPTFIADIHNKNNRTGNNNADGNYAPITCNFGSTELQANIDLAIGQSDPTTDFTGKFLVTFSKAINTSSFACDDIDFVGTASGQVCFSVNEITPNNGKNFEITTIANSTGTIIINIDSNKLTDLAGDPNGITIITDNTITITDIPTALTYQDGLIVYLPLDTDTNDHSGNGNHGNNNGTISTTGNVNGAYNFSGNGYITIPQSSTLSTSLVGNDFTMSFWGALPENRDLAILSQSPNGGPTPKWMFAVQNWGADLGYYSYGEDNSARELAQYTFTPHTDLQYYTLVKTENDFFLYKNAVQVSHSNTTPIPLVDLGMDFEIGRAENALYYNQTLDEVAIRSRALSNSEIAGLYNNGNGLSLIPTSTTYSLTYSTDVNGSISGTISQTINEGEDGTPVDAIPNPGYHFTQRNDGITTSSRTDMNISGNITVTAQFDADDEEETLPTQNNGGGTRLEKDNCPDGDNSPSYYDVICETEKTHGSAEIEKEKYIFYPQIDRYELAQFVGKLTNDILKLKTRNNIDCKFEDIKDIDEQGQKYIIYSCKYGIMGINSDGLTSKKHFKPNQTVSYNEFATVLSRLLYGVKYNYEQNWYEKHVEQIEKIGLLKQGDTIKLDFVGKIFGNIFKNPEMVER